MESRKLTGSAMLALPSLMLMVLSIDELTVYILLVVLIGVIASVVSIYEPMKNVLGWVVPLALLLNGVTYGLLLILAPVWETQVISVFAIILLIFSTVLLS